MKLYHLSAKAFKDLQEIWDYVSKHNHHAADRLGEEFRRAFEHLAGMPGAGRNRPDLPLRNVRSFAVHGYVIIYRESKPVSIARIIHGSRDLKKLLRKN